mmetsp:Transcript_65789/g.154872  ORF Transcript_65789/g.154872 Transcript_65789/m.154872 type:complete len:150 (+) Transcript_65789:565-1014(+)
MAVSWGHLQVSGEAGIVSNPSATIASSTQDMGTAHTTSVQVDVSSTASNEDSLTLALQWQGRNGPHDVTLRWTSDASACEEGVEGAAEPESPALLIVGVCLMIVAAVVAAFVLLKCFRSRAKVHPAQSPRAPQQGANNAPFTDEVFGLA